VPGRRGGLSPGAGAQEVEVEVSVERGRRLKNLCLRVAGEEAATAEAVVQSMGFAQQQVCWKGAPINVSLGWLGWFRQLWGQLAITVDSATGLQVPASLAGVPCACICRITLDDRRYHTPAVRAATVTADDVAAHRLAAAQAASADNWRELEANEGVRREEDPLLVGLRAVWKANMMLGVSDACFNEARDPRLEAAFGLRLTLLLVAADSDHERRSDASHSGGPVAAEALSWEATAAEIGSVKIDLKSLRDRADQGAQHLSFALTLPRHMRDERDPGAAAGRCSSSSSGGEIDGDVGAAGCEAAGVLKLRLWLQKEGLQQGRVSAAAKMDKGLSKAAVVGKMGAGLGRGDTGPSAAVLASTRARQERSLGRARDSLVRHKG